MLRSLDLPADVYDELSQAALAVGTTPVGWIVARLHGTPSSELDNELPAAVTTMADLFAGHIGTISSGDKANHSKTHSERFGEILEQKRREGRL